MNELEFRAKWLEDKPMFDAWGEFIVNKITREIELRGKDVNTFLKIPPKHRVKDDISLIDKAFNRAEKSYSDPYNQIEDKVGVRFVVLLLADINILSDIIEQSSDWNFDPCKHFNEDKENEPLLFTYQSVHFILKPKKEIIFKNINISTSTPCEVQVRTLLQHAHAELTHDAIYKSKRIVKPLIHRNVAKSMALIETTDELFTIVTESLNNGPLEEFKILERLDSIYHCYTGLVSYNQKSSIVIFDCFEKFIDENLIDKIQIFLATEQCSHLGELIKSNYTTNSLYQQSTILFIYWMLKNRKERLIENWPLSYDILKPLALDLSISIFDD
ncbi:GTP pyrophosphokinase family protein [Shewanella sp. SM21]|uniref:GTP pyrophosphokinase n=1 Tax=Shewanella sp. SM21 TaxID=2912793 RepID=UPI0021DA7252|nr:RelA/SpoT domain-containing protein [Shewanella sp. SM21]MCU8087671.1 RelA/SpoT domain-containing protein [Shewanella sp. SM21]